MTSNKTETPLGRAVAAFLSIELLAVNLLASPGALDPSYAPSVIGGVNAMAVQPDGKLLIGGAFVQVNGSGSRAHLARLLSDGSLDTNFFNTGSGVSSTVWSLALQTDGRIVIGGDFSVVNGESRVRVARLNPNGTVDGSFVPTNSINGSVLAVVPQPDNKVIIGGSFVGGTFPSWNARLNADGTTDATFSSFLNGAVNAMALQADGRILIGGSFTTVNGAARNRIARLNSDGSLDNTFQNGLAGASSTVRCIEVQTDGKILVGGDFGSINSSSRNFIARLNTNGSLDPGFNSGSPSGANNSVYAVIAQADNTVVIGGTFSTYATFPMARVARLYPDGSRDTAFSTLGINNTVQALETQSDGALLIGGTFTTVNNSNRASIARLYGNLYPPEFISQPLSRATNVGATVTFSALVNNPTPSSYQWRKEGINVSGATGTSYTLFNVQLGDAGSYSVFVNNSVGGVTSSNAVLQVGIAPAITQHPSNLSVSQGQPAIFNVVASGTPLKYFWRKNGSFIVGAANSSLTFGSAVFTNTGTYSCVVSNFLGSVTSSNAVLTVAAPPSITIQPGGSTIGVGSDLTLSVTAIGTAPLAYQWMKDSVPLVFTNSSFTVANAQTNDSGAYSVVITNPVGSVTSAVANVSVIYYAPAISIQPVGQTLLVGSNLTLNVTATGTAPLFYQWRKDGFDLPAATSSSFAVASAQTNDSGAYRVVVANIAGSVTSSVAQVNVGLPPVILQQPQPITNTVGSSNAFTVGLSGSQPFLFQWFKDGDPIPDATNALLSLPDLQTNHVGYYFVAVTNLYGWALSSNALLNIAGLPLPSLWLGLVAYYPFTGNADDATPNTNHGFATNCDLAPDRFANPSNAYAFNGTNSVITAPDKSYLNLSGSNFTISVWATRSASQQFGFILGKDAGNSRSPATKWTLILGRYHDPGTPTLTFHYIDDANALHWIGSAPIREDFDLWHHYAVSRSGSLFSLFQDGVLLETVTDNGTLSSSNPGNLTIGSAESGGWHAGLLDEVRIYDRALASNEIAQVYAWEADLPFVASGPRSLIVSQGANAAFQVAATARNPLAYQWNKSGLAISSATNSALPLTNIQPSQAGLYTVAISNGPTGILVGPAALSVISSTGAGAPGFTSNQFGFGLTGPAGTTFFVDASADLNLWQSISTNSFGAGLFQFLDPASTTNSIRFYRVKY